MVSVQQEDGTWVWKESDAAGNIVEEEEETTTRPSSSSGSRPSSSSSSSSSSNNSSSGSGNSSSSDSTPASPPVTEAPPTEAAFQNTRSSVAIELSCVCKQHVRPIYFEKFGCDVLCDQWRQHVCVSEGAGGAGGNDSFRFRKRGAELLLHVFRKQLSDSCGQSLPRH